MGSASWSGRGGVKSGKRLALFDAIAAAGVEDNPGMGIDGFPGFFAAGSGALHGPADGGGVHGGDVSRLPGFEHMRCAGLVKRGGIFENGNVAAMGVNHLEKDGQRRPVG